MAKSNADRQADFRSRRALRNESNGALLDLLIEIRDLVKTLRNDVTPLNGPPMVPPITPSLPPLNPPKVVARAKRLPDDWVLSDEDYAFAEQKGLEIEETFDAFCDFWRSKAGKDGTKLDWSATWRNWCRKDASNKRVNGFKAKPTPEAWGPLRDPTEIWAEMVAKGLAK